MQTGRERQARQPFRQLRQRSLEGKGREIAKSAASVVAAPLDQHGRKRDYGLPSTSQSAR
jgi:hypothetical protein